MSKFFVVSSFVLQICSGYGYICLMTINASDPSLERAPISPKLAPSRLCHIDNGYNQLCAIYVE